MSKIRNIALCVLSLIVICAAIEYKIADIGDFLPEELDNGKRSYLEGKNLQPLPDINLTSFVEGTLQDEVEDYLSGCWPARDEALLANAALQRRIIKTSNALFGYEVYPTFYGSGQVYSESENALFEMPDSASSKNANALRASAAAINSLQKDYSNTQVIVCMTDRSRITQANPLFDLTSNTIDYEFMQRWFFDELDPNITIVTNPKTTSEDFFSSYFRTDHHWNISGAYDMYRLIAKELGIEVLEPISETIYSNYPFYGSIARNGLDFDAEDAIIDYAFDLPEYQTWKNGELFERNNKTKYEGGTPNSKSAKFNAYGYYFGSDWGRLVYTTGRSSLGNCLLIGDSYTQPIEPLLASSFNKTFVLDPRHLAQSAEEAVGDNSIDTIIILAGSNTYADSRFTSITSSS